MRVARPTLVALLNSNVLEIQFARRHVKPGAPLTRRMLCTTCDNILLTENGFKTLNFQPAGEGVNYNRQQHNIVTAWDIMMQDWRSISADNVELVTQLPGDDTFWEYFNDNILPMTAEQKFAFINS